MHKKQKKSFKRRFIKKLGQVGLSILSASLILSPVSAADPAELAKDVIGSEVGKEGLNTVLKAARSKPALAFAGSIVCVSSISAAGVAASPAMCVACGIMIAKVLS